MSEKTVWALTTGAYSDYGVQALFTTKQLAEEAAEAHKADESYSYDIEVEAFTLYDEVPDPVTEWFYQATIWEKGANAGKVSDESLRETTCLPWNHLWGVPQKRPSVKFVRAPIYKGLGGRLEVRGSDKQAVQQAFSDNKARRLAEIAGVS